MKPQQRDAHFGPLARLLSAAAVPMAFALAAGALVTGCYDPPITCGVPGKTQTCDCADGRTGGTQICRSQKWTACKCTGEIPPMTDSGMGGTAGESGTGGTGGTAGESGTGGTGGTAGESGTGGTGGTAGESGTGGTGGTAGESGTGGTGGTAGESGTGGTGGSFPAAYTGPCTMDTDCGTDAVCFRNSDMTKSYCGPKCVNATTCPAAPAGGAPIVDCVAAVAAGPTGCHLSCNGFAACPTGMMCSEPVLLPNACF